MLGWPGEIRVQDVFSCFILRVWVVPRALTATADEKRKRHCQCSDDERSLCIHLSPVLVGCRPDCKLSLTGSMIFIVIPSSLPAFSDQANSCNDSLVAFLLLPGCSRASRRYS